ncbi:AGAP013233-PA-like protein [Anopheles sinensis]|uniref:AGAP013233-PA-like protein n=1 Tax=Anopheles sinensis TaxID=74873 RepID=A0A084W778_ANOSI|nr:AGAP013233-PA-like protein [Anopheles sinensis]
MTGRRQGHPDAQSSSTSSGVTSSNTGGGLFVSASVSDPGIAMSSGGGSSSGVGGGGGLGGSGSSSGSSSKKRLATLNGIPASVDDKTTDFLCPICFDIITEAHITRCGHTFCHQCIARSIDVAKKCPKCNYPLASHEHIVPNFLLNELITKHRLKGGGVGGGLPYRHKASLPGESSPQWHSGGGGGDATAGGEGDTLKHFLATESKKLSLSDVNVMLEILTQRKMLLEAESCAAQNRLLHEFLKHLLKQKEQQQLQIANEIALIRTDLLDVEKVLKEVQSSCPTVAEVEQSVRDEKDENVVAIKREIIQIIDTIDNIAVPSNRSLVDDTCSNVSEAYEGFNMHPRGPAGDVGVAGGSGSVESHSSSSSSFLARKQRMYQHFDDFVECYFAARTEDLYFGKDRSISSDSLVGERTTASSTSIGTADTGGGGGVGGTSSSSRTPIGSTTGAGGPGVPLSNATSRTTLDSTRSSGRSSLDTFRESLIKFSKYSALRPLATLNYSNDSNYASTIVSSIEFDKDSEYFAIAGVTKRIKIFDYYTAIRDAAVDINYPINEMTCNSKISCVIWNSYFKQVLASSDYEGIVTIWDVLTRTRTKTFEEHDKRCWCVDFNEVDTRLLASGSDDARVKLWSLNVDHSVATIEARANVCCVKFNPKSSCHLAFGTADHGVNYYDLRNLKQPLCQFKGHRKAVSYVKFLNTDELVSASTDGQLKLWNTNSPPFCLRSFTGHINEKNFAGLATNSDYLACGSEDNSLCVYYKGLSKQLFNLKFSSNSSTSGVGAGSSSSGGTGSGGTGSGRGRGLSSSDMERSSGEGNEFVSAVCWRKQSNIIIAGNSEGVIKILEIV